MADPTEIIIECRVEYAVNNVIVALRFFARWKTLGWRGFYWDDFFAFTSWVFASVGYAMLEFVNVKGAPIALTEMQREALTPEMSKSLREGAKAIFASFYIFIFLVWSVKGCLIAFFLRFTRNTHLHGYVRIISGVSITGFIAAVITQTTHCLPLKRNWQILPDPGRDCSAGISINIVIAVGNVLVDAMLLVVPTWMLKDTQISLWRKIKIIFLLSLGFLVMAMAITRCVLSTGTSVEVALASVWAQRETVVSIFAVNAPVINSLFRASTWKTKKSSTSYPSRHSFSNPTDPARKKKTGFEIYKMTDIETRMVDIEMCGKESTEDLVKGPSARGSSQWQCSAQGPCQDDIRND